MTYTFPLLHGKFYEEFTTAWQQGEEAKGLPLTGIYFLRTNRPVHRAIGKDYRGVLYIGKGNILPYNNRIGELVNACNNRSDQHGAGIRYRELLQSRFPLEECHIFIRLSDQAEKEERLALHYYEQQFGELPPLNRRKE